MSYIWYASIGSMQIDRQVKWQVGIDGSIGLPV